MHLPVPKHVDLHLDMRRIELPAADTRHTGRIRTYGTGTGYEDSDCWTNLEGHTGPRTLSSYSRRCEPPCP